MKPDELYLLHVYRAARPEFQIAAVDILKAHPAADDHRDKLPAEPHDGQITILAEYRYRRGREKRD